MLAAEIKERRYPTATSVIMEDPPEREPSTSRFLEGDGATLAVPGESMTDSPAPGQPTNTLRGDPKENQRLSAEMPKCEKREDKPPTVLE